MGKIILTGALAGWAAIIALAYRLASARMAYCYSDSDCLIRATNERDDILVTGLIVGLMLVVGLALLVARSAPRLNRWDASSSARSTQLR